MRTRPKKSHGQIRIIERPKPPQKIMCADCNLEITGTVIGTVHEHHQILRGGGMQDARVAPPRAVPSASTDLQADDIPKTPTGVDGFDRVIGGGLVFGGVYAICGDPGGGKSTMLGLVLAESCDRGATCLYATGEETAEAVKIRARATNTQRDRVFVIASQHWEDIALWARRLRAHVVVVDSINRIGFTRSDNFGSAYITNPVLLVREISLFVKSLPPAERIAVLCVAHINAKGGLAGPETLKHDVDVVMSLRKNGKKRELTSGKNRFGPSDVKATFEFGFSSQALRETHEDDGLVPAKLAEISGSDDGVVLVTRPDEKPTRIEVYISSSVHKNRAAVTATGIQEGVIYDSIRMIERAGCSFDGQNIRVRVTRGTGKKRGDEDDEALQLAVAVGLTAELLGVRLGRTVAFGRVSLRGAILPAGDDTDRVERALSLRPRHVFASHTADGVKSTGPVRTLESIEDLVEHLRALRDTARQQKPSTLALASIPTPTTDPAETHS